MEERDVYKPARFFFGAILITWAAWFAAAYFSYRQGGGAKAWLSVLELAGLFGPSCAALGLIFTSKNAALRREFFGKLFDLRRIRPLTLPAAVLIMPLAAVLSVFFSCLFFGRSPDQLTLIKTASYSAGLVPVPVMFFGAALAEEVG